MSSSSDLVLVMVVMEEIYRDTRHHVGSDLDFKYGSDESGNLMTDHEYITYATTTILPWLDTIPYQTALNQAIAQLIEIYAPSHGYTN